MTTPAPIPAEVADRDDLPDDVKQLIGLGQYQQSGEFPVERPLAPQDLLATIYRHLGIDHHATVPDYANRPIPILPDGEPIHELI